MKRLILPFVLLISVFCDAQQGPMRYLQHHPLPGNFEQVGGTFGYRDAPLESYIYTDSEKRKILEKQYLTTAYLTAKVDHYSATAQLRYNLFNDQMEFSKDGLIYYLKKEEGRIVNFINLDAKYKVYDVNGSLQFLKVEAQGEYSLLVKQSKKFLEPKNRRSNSAYQTHLKASFKRNKDDFYIQLGNGNIVEVPSQRSEFFALFGEDAAVVKSYMKKHKLGTRKAEDLKKVITLLNSWSDELQKG